MGAAIQLVIIPLGLFAAIMLMNLAAKFSWTTAIVIGAAVAVAVAMVVALLKLETKVEPDRYPHEKNPDEKEPEAP